jgi:glycolate oxidase FAD binding subunit
MKTVEIEDLTEQIISHPKTLPVGKRTKSALSDQKEIPTLDMTPLKGILEYHPGEFTFTALAGTPLSDIELMLVEQGQFLPFDPPLIEAGATLGGTIASGLSGSGRFRFGGLRDFILGLKFLDGNGKLVKSGGKVVKNAAGFDIPKLMVGSLGSLGAIVEATFKVFPKPITYATLIVSFASLQDSLEALVLLTSVPLDIFCLDLETIDNHFDLLIRIGGSPALFPERIDRLQSIVGKGQTVVEAREDEIWHKIREFSWLPNGASLVKVPVTPSRILELDAFLENNRALRRYSVGANVAWIGWSSAIEALDQYLVNSRLSGLVILGTTKKVRIGSRTSDPFKNRIKQALDPVGRWMEVQH